MLFQHCDRGGVELADDERVALPPERPGSWRLPPVVAYAGDAGGELVVEVRVVEVRVAQ